MARKKTTAAVEKLKPSAPPFNKTTRTPTQFKNKRHFWLSFLLVITCFILYANTLQHEYCYDDRLMITENSITQKGFDGIGEHLRHSFLYGHMQQEGYDAGSSHWRPITLITYAGEIGLWGPNKPENSHFINVCLYSIVVVLLFRLLRKHILRDTWVSFFSALLFAIHPIHTEVVANIKGRDEILCLLILLISVHLLFKFLNSNRKVFYLGSLAAFFLSLCTKENSITFLAGIPITLYFFSSLKPKSIVLYSSGFVITFILFVLVRSTIIPLSSSGMTNDVTNNPYLYSTGIQEIATKFYVMLLYLKLAVFPHPLTVDYSFNHIPYADLSNMWVWVSILIYLTLLIYAIKGLKSKKTLSFSILMFFITFSVSTNLVVETGVMMAERMLFIPSIFFVLSVCVAGKAFIDFAQPKLNFDPKLLTALCIAPVFIAAMTKVTARNKDWKNDITLNLADIKTSPQSARVNAGAGSVYNWLADEAENSKYLRDSLYSLSIKYFQKAVEIHPRYTEAWLNMGLNYLHLDSIVQAESCLIIAERIDSIHPRLVEMRQYVGKGLLNKGIELNHRKQFDSAIQFYEKSARHFSEGDTLRLMYFHNIANAYYLKGDYEKAKNALQEIATVNPHYPYIQRNLQMLKDLIRDKGGN